MRCGTSPKNAWRGFEQIYFILPRLPPIPQLHIADAKSPLFPLSLLWSLHPVLPRYPLHCQIGWSHCRRGWRTLCPRSLTRFCSGSSSSSHSDSSSSSHRLLGVAALEGEGSHLPLPCRRRNRRTGDQDYLDSFPPQSAMKDCTPHIDRVGNWASCASAGRTLCAQ